MFPRFKVKVLKKAEIAQDTLALWLSKPPGFSFIPGQYIGITLKLQTSNSKRGTETQVKSFSLVNTPRDKFLEIAFRKGPSDYKKALEALKVGEVVWAEGPYGQFTLHEDAKRPAVFIAGGIGIAPVVGMVRQIKNEKSKIKVSLIYSNKKPERAAYVKELQKYATNGTGLKCELVFTEPRYKTTDSTGIRFRTGQGPVNKKRVGAKFLKKYVKKNAVYYVVGNPEMVDGITEILRKLKVAEGSIKREVFTGY